MDRFSYFLGLTMDLLALHKAIIRDLDILDYPKKDWVLAKKTSRAENILDVFIIGGGQSGLSISFGLIREKVKNILAVDQNPIDQAGPWNTFARMITLRTPKHVIGPELGIPNLSVRAWYEAKYGADKWLKLSLIPKEDWACYLSWYEKVLNLPVEHETKVLEISWLKEENCFQIICEKINQKKIYFARKIVLANGIDGAGEWHTPSYIKKSLEKEFYAHTNEHIDFLKLKNKTVGVIGAGASAFDAAAVALENKAKAVHLFFRRAKLPHVNPYRWAEFTGFLNHHGDLSDENKWDFIEEFILKGQLPPKDTFLRASKFKNFYLEAKQDIKLVERHKSQILLETKNKKYMLDFLILGTGFKTDLKLRPELKLFEPFIARWKDRYPEKTLADLEEHPYLGANFEFLEKTPGLAPYLGSIFCYNAGCLLSLGFGGASISGLKYSLPKLIFGITKSLYVEDAKYFLATLKNYDFREF
jgi:cation diffusion facilitator CzcD-associated flavoprotein CzcO